MLDNLNGLINAAQFGATYTSITVVAGKIEESINPDLKTRISDWLLGKEGGSGTAVFAGVFNHVFGRHVLSRKGLTRSTVFSIVALLMMTIIWSLLRTAECRATLDNYLHSDLKTLFVIVFIPTCCYIVAVYLGLLISSAVLNRSTLAISSVKVAFFLILEAVSIVGVTAGCLAVIVWISRMLNNDIDWSYFAANVGPGLVLRSASGEDPSIGIWFYAGMLPSVWIMLHLLSGVVIRGFRSLHIEKGLDVTNRPVKSLGIVIATLTCIILVCLKSILVLA